MTGVERVLRSTPARLSILHGPGHWLRVAETALWLVERTPGADARVACLFAVLHDAGRRADGRDPGHGERAAALVLQVGPGVLTRRETEELAGACRDHELGYVTTDPTVGVCWDADRLDLWRVGRVPSKRLLSTRAARTPIARAMNRSPEAQLDPLARLIALLQHTS